MKRNCPKVIVVILCLSFLLFLAPGNLVYAAEQVPVKGMVTMIDLGAGECVPCKLMAPIMVKVEKAYAGKAAIVFIDVWKDPAPAKRFGIRYIPTQIFFDKKGREVFRHEGFFSEEDIVRQFRKMGIKLEG
ncbi:MAG: thioredoxin family protein [Syntrophobacterales bacterium]|nr:thioredoxin family protein [Syntrophobacterales bacterium]